MTNPLTDIKMDFAYVSNTNNQTIKRTLTVTIAGIAVAIAACSAPSTLAMSDATIFDPLANAIETSTVTHSLDNLGVPKIDETIRRAKLLDDSLRLHGYDIMDANSMTLWKILLSHSANVPFSNVYAQYGESSESFFIVFYFDSEHRIDATIYADEDDRNVYFSIASKGEVFFQNALPINEFFECTKKTLKPILNDLA